MSATNASSISGKRTQRDGDLDASFIAQVLSRPTSASALALLTSKKSCTQSRRRRVAVLAGIESSWCNCDQSIPGNVSDLAGLIVKELHEPYWFYRTSLFGDGDGEVVVENDPRSMFGRHMATLPLLYSGKFWTAGNGAARYPWLPSLKHESHLATFDAVVHFVQGSSGTGIHIGDGRILTCAHVIETRDDDAKADDDESYIPNRIGRRKIVMFPSGRIFIAECRVVQETLDGSNDVAILVLGAELAISPLHTTDTMPQPPAAVVAGEAVAKGSQLFCIGNPSNVDLESHEEEDLELDPPTWHTSVGTCEGYLDPSVHMATVEQDVHGRPPTRGEWKAARKAEPVNAEVGAFLLHSCWTYWGHSGALLFDRYGKVVGLHCAWNDRTGIRHGQKLQYIHHIIHCLSDRGE